MIVGFEFITRSRGGASSLRNEDEIELQREWGGGRRGGVVVVVVTLLPGCADDEVGEWSATNEAAGSGVAGKESVPDDIGWNDREGMLE